MAKLSTDELLDAFKEMTLIELSEFVKQFEETFGVTAAAPVAVAAAGAPAGGGDSADAAATFTIFPEPASIIRGATARAIRMTVIAFRSIIDCHIKSDVSCTGVPMAKPPAMLHSTSIRP